MTAVILVKILFNKENMGNTNTISHNIDVMYEMSVSERLEHLVSGFMPMDNKKHKKHCPREIISICINYTGINKHNDYHLIKSNTEIKQELEEARKRKEAAKKHQETYNNGYCTPEIKIAIFGGGGVGKSALYIRFTTGNFLEEYDPTIEDAYRPSTQVDGRMYLLDILDTAGQEEFSNMQDQWMREAEVFLLVYDITRRYTFDEIPMWIDKIQRIKDDSEWYAVIAGNKIDLANQRQVTKEEGERFVNERNKTLESENEFPCLKFYETSAKEKINNELVFFECVRWVTHGQWLREEWNENQLEKQVNYKQNCCCEIL
eukprot:553008_1